MTERRQIRESAHIPDPLNLDFWGARVSVFVDHVEDLDHLTYYFRDYVHNSNLEAASTTLWLESPAGPFTQDLSTDQAVWIEHGDGPIALYCRPTDEAQPPTPLPPFYLPPLADCVKTVHASAACPPSAPEKAVVLHGASTAGKSTILLELLRLNWSFVADDTVAICSDQTLLPYTRPIGIRQATFDRSPWLSEFVGEARTFQTPTGLTRALHARDFGAAVSTSKPTWQWTVELVPSEIFKCERLGTSTIRMSLNVSIHLAVAVEAISELVSGEGRVEKW